MSSRDCLSSKLAWAGLKGTLDIARARWSAVAAISRDHGGDKIKADYRPIAERRGRNTGRVAAPARVLRLVYYGLRDGESVASRRTRQAEPARTQPADGSGSGMTPFPGAVVNR